ncbi:histidine phosphatase family protein [Myxococcota bacterium]|nr:histidine phosphatase family protein [Myxococcota bacterium]
MAILLIRHGETAGNRNRIIQVPETPLSEDGLAQAARLGRRLAGANVAEIWSSHLMRAHQTAQAIERTTGAPLALHPELEERNFGDLRGTPYSELRVDPFVPHYDPPGGEGWDAFHERVDRMWARIERHWHERYAGRDESVHLAIVSHGLFLRSLLERRLLTREQLERHGDGEKIVISNTALSVVAPRAGSVRAGEGAGATAAASAADAHRVELVACTAHLEAEPELLAPV